MEGAIHIPHQLQKKSLDVQPIDDREEGAIDQYPPTLLQANPYSFSYMIIQRQRGTKTSGDGKDRSRSPVLQKQMVDSNPGLSFRLFIEYRTKSFFV